jgi:hypothetical protein
VRLDARRVGARRLDLLAGRFGARRLDQGRDVLARRLDLFARLEPRRLGARQLLVDQRLARLDVRRADRVLEGVSG